MKITYFQGADGDWYWHLTAKNRHIIAAGGEGYASRRNVLRAISRFKSLLGCLGLQVVAGAICCCWTMAWSYRRNRFRY